jgi:hypothetical protein
MNPLTMYQEPSMSITHLENGAKVRTFPLPPAGFDPLQADDAHLHKHGLPPRPTERPELMELWERWVLAQYIVPTFQPGPSKRLGARPKAIADGRIPSPAWSGVVTNNPTRDPIDCVMGCFTVPNVYAAAEDGKESRISCWVGIDGTDNVEVFQAGVTCIATSSGAGTFRDVYAWWEWYPALEMKLMNFPVSFGDSLAFYLFVDSRSSGNGYVYNTTANLQTGFHLTPPGTQRLEYISAEWIVERPQVNEKLVPMARYGTVVFDNALASNKNGQDFSAAAGSVTYDMTDDAGKVTSRGFLLAPGVVQCQSVV